MKTQYKAFFIKPKLGKKGYYIVNPLTFKFGQILRKAICTWSWGDVYAKLHVTTTEDLPSSKIPVIVRKDKV